MGRTIAVIPARGGSKSIPYKNIVNFLDRPLIEHVIESAHRSLEIDEIICSTDSDRIASIVENLGVKVDSRVESLSQDCTPIVDVLKDLTARLDDVDIVPLLQPTSPFILPEHIDACVLSIKRITLSPLRKLSPSFHIIFMHIIKELLKMDMQILNFCMKGNCVITSRVSLLFICLEIL